MAPTDAGLEVFFTQVNLADRSDSRAIVLTDQKSSIPIGRASTKTTTDLRPADDNLWIACPVMSRQHAKLHLERDLVNDKPKAIVVDQDSAHGTYINERKLTAHRPYEIHNGDELKFGSTVVREKDTFYPPVFSVATKIVPPREESVQPISVKAASVGFSYPSDSEDDVSEDYDSEDDANKSDISRLSGTKSRRESDTSEQKDRACTYRNGKLPNRSEELASSPNRTLAEKLPNLAKEIHLLDEEENDFGMRSEDDVDRDPEWLSEDDGDDGWSDDEIPAFGEKETSRRPQTTQPGSINLPNFSLSAPTAVPERPDEDDFPPSFRSAPSRPQANTFPFGLLEDRDYHARYFDGPFAFHSVPVEPLPSVVPETLPAAPPPLPPRDFTRFEFEYSPVPFSSRTVSTSDHIQRLREQPKAGPSNRTDISISSLINAANPPENDVSSSREADMRAGAGLESFSFEQPVSLMPEPAPEFLASSEDSNRSLWADSSPPPQPMRSSTPDLQSRLPSVSISTPVQRSKQLPSPAVTNSPSTGTKRKLADAQSENDIPVFITPVERKIAIPTCRAHRMFGKPGFVDLAPMEVTVSKAAEIVNAPVIDTVSIPVAEKTEAKPSAPAPVVERPARRRRLNSWARNAVAFALGGVATAAWMMASIDSEKHYFA